MYNSDSQEQSQKARLPMLVTEPGIATLAMLLPAKAPTPMLVTEPGIATLATLLHPAKA